MKNTRLAGLALSLTLSLVPAGLHPQAQQTSSSPPAAVGAREWPAVGGHLSNARYSPIAAINRSRLNTVVVSTVTSHDFTEAGNIGFQAEAAELQSRNIRIRPE